MSTLKIWGLILCFSSVGGSVLFFLIPKGRIEKTMKTVFSLFIMISALFPIAEIKGIDLSHLDIQNSSPELNYEEIENIAAEFAIKRGTESVKKQIDELLSGICNEAFNCEVTLNNNNGGDLEIIEITVSISPVDTDKTNRIKEEIGNITGIIPKVGTYE